MVSATDYSECMGKVVEMAEIVDWHEATESMCSLCMEYAWRLCISCKIGGVHMPLGMRDCGIDGLYGFGMV